MATNSELELLLNDYLDGELDGEECRRVEAAIRADSAMSERMEDLRLSRDAVSSLRKEGIGIDQSTLILARIRRRRALRMRLVAAATVGTSIAASWLLILAVGGRGVTPDPIRRPEIAAGSPAPRKRPAPIPMGIVSNRRMSRPAAAIPITDAAIRPPVLAKELRDREDRSALRSLLAEGQTRRVDVVVDEFERSLKVVDGIVGASPRTRPDHAKVHLVQSVQSGDASRSCVYVLVMDEHEYKEFRQTLDDRFPEAVSDSTEAKGEAVAALGSVGRIEVLTGGVPSGVLMPPPSDAAKNIAKKAHPDDPGSEVLIDPKGNIIPRSRSKSDVPTHAAKGTDKPADGDRPPTRSVYLVWVLPRERGRG